MIEKKPITAILRNAGITDNIHKLYGNVEADTLNRFKDGELITTSEITARYANIFYTKNSIYYVASWAADSKPTVATDSQEVLTRFRKFVDMIEARAMAVDGPVTPFLEELAAATNEEKGRFVSILGALYKLEIPA